MASITTHKSNGDKAGESPKILCEMLRYLGHQERPLYQGFKEVVNDREEWRVEVLIHTTKKPNKPLIIEAARRRATFSAGIRDAACQAMYRLSDMYADDLSTTPYHYFPLRRICNTDKEILHYYKKKHHHQHDRVLNQQIRLTEVLVEVCDDAFDELREARCKIRELEEELRKQAPRHKHKAIAASSPPPHRRVIVGDKKTYQSPGHKAAAQAPAPAPAARKRTSVVVGNTNRKACLSLQRKPAPTTRCRRGAAAPPAPCGRLLARGVVNEDSVSSFGGGGSSSSAHQLPQGQGDGHRPPIASTPKGFLMHPVVSVEVEGPRRDDDASVSSSSSFEGRMHGSNLMAVAVEGPRRDGAPSSSSSFERRMHGRKLMAFILDGGVALGKEPANAIANNSDDATTSAAARLFWENMEKPCSCSSARRRRLL